MDITDDAMLTQVLNSAAVTVVTNVSAKILALLQQYIMTETYGSHQDSPNRYYAGGTKQPTMEFLKSLEWTPIANNITSITTMLWENYLSMSYFGEEYIHGDPLTDRRAELAEDLNVLGIDLDNDFGGKNRRPFWNDFIYELLQENKITEFFNDEFEALGFEIG